MDTINSYKTSNFSTALERPKSKTSEIDPWAEGLATGSETLAATSALATTGPWGTVAAGVISLGAGIWSGVSAGAGRDKENEKLRKEYFSKSHAFQEDKDNILRAQSAINNPGFYSNFYAKEGGKIPPAVNIMKEFISNFESNAKLQQGGTVKALQANKSSKEFDEESEFIEWYSAVAKKKGLDPDPYADEHYYDYKEYWRNEDKQAILSEDKDAHFTDKYKLPGHPTFSKESIYSTDETPGGEWAQDSTGTWFFEHSPYTLQYDERTKEYLKGTGEYVKEKTTKHREGGKMNIIPDGALHSRKNKHGDKGVPVVTENGANLDKAAEIEKEEIIFYKDLTVWLEQMVQKYQSNPEDQDLLVEVGTRLQDEILNNTQDNTKLLKSKK